jgi:uncharacterized membrane protein YfhO
MGLFFIILYMLIWAACWMMFGMWGAILGFLPAGVICNVLLTLME